MSLYVTWLAAWSVLGHMPRPYLDDPKFIGWVVDVPYALAIGLLNAAPVAAGATLLLAPLALVRPGQRVQLRRSLLGYVGVVALWVAAIGVLYLDPGDVTKWFLD